MQSQIVKRQAALFGSFNFSPTPDTSLKLLQIFAQDGFMPQVITLFDQTTGLNSQKMSLSRGSDFQVVFSNDRIDIVKVWPSSDETLSGFVGEVVRVISKLDGGSLSFPRIAIVEDIALQGLVDEQASMLRKKLLPMSGDGAIEWVARWVNPEIIDGEKYNVNIEAVLTPGLALIVGGVIKTVNGVKVMHDISTSPENLAVRFNNINLEESLQKIVHIIEKKKSEINFY